MSTVKGNALIGREFFVHCDKHKETCDVGVTRRDVDQAFVLALKLVAALEIPHLESEEGEGEFVH